MNFLYDNTIAVYYAMCVGYAFEAVKFCFIFQENFVRNVLIACHAGHKFPKHYMKLYYAVCVQL